MTLDHFEAAETSYFSIAKRVTLEVSNLGDIPWSLKMLSIEPSKGYDPQLCHCTCIILERLSRLYWYRGVMVLMPGLVFWK